MTAVTAETPGDIPVAALCASVFERPFLRLPEIAALRAHDSDHGSEYVATLTAYLDALGNATGAAARLGVHVNTFRYRMRRLVALSGLDLAHPDVRLACALELAAPEPERAPVVPAEDPVAVVAFRVLDSTDDVSCRLARMVALSWDALRTSAWCDVTGHTVYSVVTVASASSADLVASTARRIVHQAERALGATIVAGVGPVVAGPHGAETSKRLADDVLRVVLAGRAPRVATLDDVRTSVVLHEVMTAATQWPDLDGGAVTRLATHDKARRTAYVDSLRAYVTTFGDVPAAAAEVFVHARTFRYRLRRIEALCGIRLDDPLTRLAVALELRIKR